MSVKTLARIGAAAAALVLFGTAMAACGEAPAMQVTSPEDVLGLSTRLVFSTNHNLATAPRSVTLTNAGATAINVTGLTLGGASPGQFALADGQASSFTIDPGSSAIVGVRFVPTATGAKYATLTIASSSATPSYVVNLRGMSARGTQGSTEPQLSTLMQLFGFTTNVGFTAPGQATTRAPVGDEVVAPYFTRVDSSQPVTLTPIARYVAANYQRVDTGRTAKNSSARTTMYRFPEDTFVDDTPGNGTDDSIYAENQKTFPNIYSGGFSFNPSAAFGFYGNFGNYTDDSFNVDENLLAYRNVRVYPAKGADGTQIQNWWLLGVDVNTTPDKNYDFQDQVMLLKNATPELVPGPTPGSAETTLSFDSAIPGTVADKDGEGTGFTSTQPNRSGTQAKPALIDLAGGRLAITSTDGKNSGTTAGSPTNNTQDNALQLNFDGSRSDTFVQTRILGPMSDLTTGAQQKAVYYGFDQDNYLKVEIEHRTSPTVGVFITVFREQAGSTATVGQVQIADPASVATLDLGIVADLETGSLRGVYRINADTGWTDLGSTFSPTAVTRFFSPQALAGVLTSHTGSTTPIVATYESFGVSVSPT